MQKWNWQLSDWPDFSYDPAPFNDQEAEFLRKCGQGYGLTIAIDDEEREALRVEMLSNEAMTTSRIEGEVLDRASVQSSIRQNLGLQVDARKGSIPEREKGVADLMTENFKRYAEPLTQSSLRFGHKLLMVGQLPANSLGVYRPGKDPMEIVSGSTVEPKIHFEAPPSSRVPDEMERFIDWFNESSLPALTRAGIAHVYFESIHPFSDGNGRIGRAIAEKALSQGAGHPIMTSISQVIEAKRKQYYAALASTRFTNDITEWLTFFAESILEAIDQGNAQIEFLIKKSKFFVKHSKNLNSRQEKVLLRMFREGPNGFKGGLSAGNYISRAQTSPATARRDLGELIEMGILTKTGERKGTRYFFEL